MTVREVFMDQKRVAALFRSLLNQPIILWVSLGFAFAFYCFFIDPVFLNAQHAMAFFNYIPVINPIGSDLQLTTQFSETWFIQHQSPYTGLNLYPPLAMVLHAPFIFLKLAAGYKLITLINLACFAFLATLIPRWFSRENGSTSILILFLVSGIVSYGFQFELERGEYDLMVMSLCLLSLYLYHFQPRFRLLAYFLFTISVQIKLYPAIFIVFLVSDWSDWKNNLKRWTVLLVANLAGLFIFGPQIFMDFVNGVKELGAQSSYFMWMGNHSIRSFALYALPRITADLHLGIWPDQYAGMTQAVLYLFLAVCLLVIWLKVVKQNAGGINPYLLLACMIGVLLIPSISHDYTLCLLPGILSIFFCGVHLSERRPRRITSILLILILSGAYASTLFSFTNKPVIWQNNLPALAIMLLCCTCLWMLDDSAAG